MLLLSLEDFTAALPHLEQAYIVNQTNLEFIENLSNCYLQLGNIIKATELLEHAVNLNPNKESIQHNLAILYLRASNYSKAEQHFKLALKLNHNNQTAKHMLAALAKQTTNQAPQDYITNLFDQYAWYYNKHLRETLQYKLPEKFRSLYAKHSTTITAQNTLDLGCGTGLCGIYFRDATVNLIGVDLSKNMLLQARSMNSYDLLIQGNIQKNIIFQDNYFDLIIAADVVPYMGDLENLFSIIKNILKNKFLFNIELTQDDAMFKLQQTGRYAYSKTYIEKLAIKFDLEILECLPEIIRLQNNNPINGMIFLLYTQ